ncbi:6010_t:CDS:2 [Acaulospora morrowiae]|uniref:6010_t:CDS:1 n=1 Tax=Acaulospora morrowiae TaxID=94023 RepID=A0A9N9BBW5_9GLOM|nr:6010_t:CDS:2 [Acaulospora morrowiae]
MVLISPGTSDEKVLDEHLKSNCTLHLLSSPPSVSRKKCDLKECNNKSSDVGVMVYVICDGCGETFCLKHRHPSTHQCTSLNDHAEAKAKRRQMAEELISRYFKKSSNVAGSSKSSAAATTKNSKKKKNKTIETMKLKSKAQGDDSIPLDSRLYLLVVFPRDSNLTSKPMFFNKASKVLDKISKEGRIRNVNNQLPLDDPERLILLNLESGNTLSTEKRLSELVESGDSVGLEKLGDVTIDK